MRNTNYSVKNRLIYLILLFLILGSNTANAKMFHYFGAYANAGEWSMIPYVQGNYPSSLGAGGGFGGVYELQMGKPYGPTRYLLTAGIGLQGGWSAFSQHRNQEFVLKDQKTSQNETFDYVYTLTSTRDRYSTLAMQIPLMMGVQHKRFYALLGVKISANMWSQVHSSATISTMGRQGDTRFPATQTEDNQFYKDKQLDNGPVKTKLNADVSVSAEVGSRLGFVTDAVGYDVPKSRMEMRLGAFVDCGATKLFTKGQLPALLAKKTGGQDVPLDKSDIRYSENKNMLENLVLNDIGHTDNGMSWIANLMIGVRFTILFQLPEKKSCVVCQDAYRSSARTNWGSRGMQYEE